MLQVSFVLAGILAAEAVVLAHPTSYARRNEPLSMVPRSGNQDVNSAPPFSMENLYEEIVNSLMKDQNPRHGSADAAVTPVHRNQNWFGIRGYGTDEVERRGLSDLEGLETRALGGGGEEKMERRELDDGLMGLAVRESGDGGELDARGFEEGPALMPRGRKRGGRRRGRGGPRRKKGGHRGSGKPNGPEPKKVIAPNQQPTEDEEGSENKPENKPEDKFEDKPEPKDAPNPAAAYDESSWERPGDNQPDDDTNRVPPDVHSKPTQTPSFKDLLNHPAVQAFHKAVVGAVVDHLSKTVPVA